MENNFKFYNTLTRQIDTVVPRVDGKIKINNQKDNGKKQKTGSDYHIEI